MVTLVSSLLVMTLCLTECGGFKYKAKLNYLAVRTELAARDSRTCR